MLPAVPGVGAAPAKGKGKGKGLPPPPPGPPPPGEKGAAAHKGAGKSGKGARSLGPRLPPPELTAPKAAARLIVRGALTKAEGTIWQGLSPWRADGAGVLQGSAVDMEAIRRLWGPMPEPPLPLQAEARRGHLPDQLQQSVEIPVRAKNFSVELVRRGLMEDALALNPEQAEVLYTAVVPAVRAAEPHLLVVVNSQGVAALNGAEQVLWTLANMPMMEARARLVHEQHLVDEEVAQVQRSVDAAVAVTSMLEQSVPVRTVFQMVLAVRNILTQSGHKGYVVTKTFEGLPMERAGRHAPTAFDPATGLPLPVDHQWLREHNPSVLRLVAEMLESTHERRCRLRFLRLLAVGRLVQKDSLRRRVWAFLDDLQASPRDALASLAECSSGLCNRDLLDELSRSALKFRHLETQELTFLRGHASFVAEGRWEQQIEAAAVKFADALEVCDEACRSVSQTAVRLCRLGGESACTLGSLESFQSAGAVLCSMRLLGTRLRDEMAFVQARRRERAMTTAALVQGLQSRPVRRHWALVDTRGHELMATSDLDRIRQLRWRATVETEETEALAPAREQTSAAQPQLAASSEREVAIRSFNDLVHTGAEGVYRKDPNTGKWGPRLDGVDGTSPFELKLGGPTPEM